MKFFKPALLLVTTLLFLACASADKEDEEIIIIAQKDPVITLEARKNAKLYKQTPQQMFESLKFPDITYEFDSIRPPEYSYDFLDKLVVIMKDKPHMRLIIEGHTDPVGDKDYNYWLASTRAMAMKSYLVSRGINAEAIRVHSHGADRPVTLDTSREGRWANRRVQFKMTNRNWNSVY